MMVQKGYLQGVKLPVCVLIILFGMGSWVAVNGVWVELPVLVHQLPEGWTLPTYMTIIIQVANLGPLIYTMGHLLMPRIVTEKPAAYLIIVTGCVASVLMAFLWQKTGMVGDKEYSLYFFAMLFLISLTDCTSSVVFLPFMNVFKPQYMTSYYIGGGFSGLVPSIVSFVQGVGQTECLNVSVNTHLNDTNTISYDLQEVYLSPHFPARDFFLFVFCMMLVCGGAFIALNHLPYCREEYVKDESHAEYDKTSEEGEYNADGPLRPEGDSFTKNPDVYSEDDTVEGQTTPNFAEEQSIMQADKPAMSTLTYLVYLVIIGWVNVLTNGVLLSVQSFACLPYGDQTYHLSVTLCNVINPVACFMAFFVTVKSTTIITAMTAVGSLISGYIIAIASYSPNPPLLSSVSGPIVIVSAYALVYLLFTYVKVNIATLFRLRGKRSLLWCGVATQTGSTVGSIVMFITVNVYNLFASSYACS